MTAADDAYADWYRAVHEEWSPDLFHFGEEEAERWGDRCHEMARIEVVCYVDDYYAPADEWARNELIETGLAVISPDDFEEPDSERTCSLDPQLSRYGREALRAALDEKEREQSAWRKRQRDDLCKQPVPPARRLRTVRPRARRRRVARRVAVRSRGPDDSEPGEPEPPSPGGVDLPPHKRGVADSLLCGVGWRSHGRDRVAAAGRCPHAARKGRA